MHEASLVEALFDNVDRAIAPHGPAAVRALAVRLGALAGVERVLFETAFEVLRTHRGYDAATLVIAEEPAEWRCRACDGPAVVQGCERCGGAARLARGDGVFLDRVELEVPDV